jgi:hypothetical protein
MTATGSGWPSPTTLSPALDARMSTTSKRSKAVALMERHMTPGRPPCAAGRRPAVVNLPRRARPGLVVLGSSRFHHRNPDRHHHHRHLVTPQPSSIGPSRPPKSHTQETYSSSATSSISSMPTIPVSRVPHRTRREGTSVMLKDPVTGSADTWVLVPATDEQDKRPVLRRAKRLRQDGAGRLPIRGLVRSRV